MKKKEMPSFDRLVIGSKYRIISLSKRDETMETVGTFKGYMYLGRDQALKIELECSGDEPEPLRVIPSHMILYMDIIEQMEQKKEKSKGRSSSYFG
ncbi:MAG: hypothetical protein R6U17_02445 [Thermoplasmata archaeon]